MSNNSLLLESQKKYYNAINTEPTVEEKEQKEQDKPVSKAERENQNIINYYIRRNKEREEERQKHQCTEIAKFITVCFIGIILVILVIIIICILCSILFVAVNACIEYIIVSMFGRAVYNKNFPVCSNTIYAGNNCYATTSTYCS